MTGSKKESGISISDMEQRFLALSEDWEEKAGIKVQLARIFGSRWSYVSGPMPKGEGPLPVKRLRLNESWGLLVYCPRGQDIDEQEVTRVFGKLLKS